MWIAHYGHAKVTVLNPDGTPHHVIALAADQPTCPAFGGPDRRSLFVTSAGQSKAHPDVADGRVLRIETQAQGQAEHRVIL
jgi:sugar lactone lactonase YvrE